MIFCLGIETVKHIEPLRYFGADKAYMLYLEKKPLFSLFRKEVVRQANEILKEPLQEKEVKVYDFAKTMATIVKIVKAEKAASNIVYLNLDGPPNYASAAMITAMMEDCETFYTPTVDHQITDIKMFQDDKGNLIGLAKQVREPVMVPKFQLNMPAEDLVKGLRVWMARKEKKGIMSDNLVIKDLKEAKLMGIHNDDSEIKQAAKMYYRRHFLSAWEELGWVQKDKNTGKHDITDEGVVAGKVFYVD